MKKKIGKVRLYKKYLLLLQKDFKVLEVINDKNEDIINCTIENDYYDGDIGFALSEAGNKIEFYYDVPDDALTKGFVKYIKKNRIKYVKYEDALNYAKTRDKTKESKDYKILKVDGKSIMINYKYKLLKNIYVEQKNDLYNFYFPLDNQHKDYAIGLSAPCNVLDSFCGAVMNNNIMNAIYGEGKDYFDDILEKDKI
jgi:hypothetical protein